MLVERNQTIKYQGAGAHISHKHDSQLLVIKNIGRFEIKGVSSKKTKRRQQLLSSCHLMKLEI